MKADEEARLYKEASHKAEEHKRTHLKIEEGVCLYLEARRREEERARLESEEEACLV